MAVFASCGPAFIVDVYRIYLCGLLTKALPVPVLVATLVHGPAAADALCIAMDGTESSTVQDADDCSTNPFESVSNVLEMNHPEFTVLLPPVIVSKYCCHIPGDPTLSSAR